MATIATMAVQLTANTQALAAGLEKAQAALSRFTAFTVNSLNVGLVDTARSLFQNLGNTITQGLSAIPVLGPLLGFVTGAITSLVDKGFDLLAYLKSAWQQMKETGKLAQSLGISVTVLSGLLFAAGGNSEQMARSLDHLNRTLGKAQLGSKEAQAAFGRLGLDYAELAKLPVDRQFFRVADAIAALKNPALQASTAFDIFGKQVGPLLGLLKQGEAGIAKFQEIAQRRGLVFSDDDVAAARAASRALEELDKTFVGLKNAFAIAVTPIAAELLKFLNEAANKVGGFPELFKAMADHAAVFLAQTAEGVSALILKVEALLDRFDRLTTFKPPAWLSAFIASQTAIFTDTRPPAQQDFGSSLAQQAAGAFTKLGQALRDVASGMRNIPKPPDLGDPAAEKLALLYDRQQKVLQALETPLDKFQDTLSNLNELLDAGLLGWEQYGAAGVKALEDLERAQKLAAPKSPAAALEGSREAYSAIVAFRQGERGDDPQKRIEQILAQSKILQERQARAAEETAKALQNVTLADF